MGLGARRLWPVYGSLVTAVVCALWAHTAKAKTDQKDYDEATCAGFVIESRKLEKSGVTGLLAMSPDEVSKAHGRTGLDKVRRYLTVRERILFQCPIGIENAAVRQIRSAATSDVPPPLPVRGPRQTKVVPADIAPLPVKSSISRVARPKIVKPKTRPKKSTSRVTVPLPVKRKTPFRHKFNGSES